MKKRINTKEQTKRLFGSKVIGKKGNITLLLFLFAGFIFAAILIFRVSDLSSKVGDMGETPIKIINTFEATERVFFYMDASIDIAAKEAATSTISASGYSEETFKGKIQNAGCGKLTYPIIDSQKNIDECFPDYEQMFKSEFIKNMNSLILKYDPLKINVDELDTVIVKENGNMKIWVQSLTDLGIPVYAYVESYYSVADKTKTARTTIDDVVTNEDGYQVARKYSILASFARRQNDVPTTIIVHDTDTSSIEETYNELKTGLRNYNYIIDKNGKVFLFTPESRYTKSAYCLKSTSKTCMYEDADRTAISVALLNSAPHAHLPQQIAALKNLLAEIANRNEINLSMKTVLLDSEIDTSRTDPSSDIKNSENQIITDAKDKLSKMQSSIGTGNTNANGNTNGNNAGTGNVIVDTKTTNPEANADLKIITAKAAGLPADINEKNCFKNIRTTVYYTPFFNDFGIWSVGGACGTSYQCCLKQDSFFPAVRCQGSGSMNGQVFKAETISPLGPTQSPTISGHKNGVTAMGTDPIPGRTVAAKCDSRFKRGAKLYIYWGEGNSKNGYYIVEDTGSALACDHIDIYGGAGKTQEKAFQSQIKDRAEVCVLDSNFQMPSEDFSGTSDTVETEAGTYLAKYSFQTRIYNVTKLFDNTKEFFKQTINLCTTKQGAEKDNCISNQIQSAGQDPELKVSVCDKELEDDIMSISDYNVKISSKLAPDQKGLLLGKITDIQTRAKGPLNQAMQTQGVQTQIFNDKEITLAELLADPNATIKIKDSTGELVIKIISNASVWTDYENEESELYKTNQLLKLNDQVLVKVNYSKEANAVFVENFEDISPNPTDIAHEELVRFAKSLTECASVGDACTCTIKSAKVLNNVQISNETLTDVDNDDVIDTQLNILGSVPFITLNMTKIQTFTVKGNLVVNAVNNTLQACIPTQKYMYICSSLTGDESLGTLKYALKI